MIFSFCTSRVPTLNSQRDKDIKEDIDKSDLNEDSDNPKQLTPRQLDEPVIANPTKGRKNSYSVVNKFHRHLIVQQIL